MDTVKDETLLKENKQLKKRITELEKQTFELDKEIFELKVLYDIARETTTTQDIGIMLKVFLSMTMGTFGISKGFVVLARDNYETWEIITSRGINLSYEGVNVDLNEFKHLKNKKEAWLISNIVAESEGNLTNCTLFKWLLSIPICVWAPIVSDDEVIGSMCIGAKISGEDFYKENLNLLSIIATNCALNIRNARLFQENLEKERIERENEELKRLDKKKSEFVNMVAHELRTPLTSISGFSELMMKKAESKPRESLIKFSTIIFQESDRLRRIINDLLDLSRIKSGKVEMNKKMNDLKQVIEMTVTNLQLSADKKNIELNITIPDEIKSFYFDKDKITQVIINLLSNAIKYTPSGGSVSVDVDVFRYFVKCSVSDTGVGIPQEDISKIFEEFHRVNNEISKNERGTGLGLPITKSIIEAHGGKLYVDSIEGQGSTFTFEIPFNES